MRDEEMPDDRLKRFGVRRGIHGIDGRNDDTDIRDLRKDLGDLSKQFAQVIGGVETRASSRHEELKDAIGALRLTTTP